MRKNPIKAGICVGLFMMLPLAAHAAGLGRLTVTSALGQPLRGEIELLSVDKSDIGTLTARIATYEAFKEANIERNPALSAIRFSVEQKTSGEPYLKLTSTQALNEPFLDMLIEVNWPAGRLVREYTVLLDPPGYAEAPAAVAPVALPSAAAPVAAPAPAAAPAPVAGPAPEMKPEEVRAAIPLDEKLLAAKPKPAAAEKAEPAKPAKAKEDTYGPVKKGENLAKIATEVKPEGVSLEQMLVAMFRSNKEAFDGNNMNRLKTGQILRVPESDQAGAINREAAAKEVKVQAADWNAYRQKLASAVAAAKPEKEEGAVRSAAGKITPAVEEKAPPKEAAKDVLKLSKSEAAAKAGAGATKETRAMQERLQALQEEATAREAAIKDANRRIAELEKSIKEMQRLLELKNQSMADLQKQAAAVAAAKPVAVPEPVKPAAVEQKPAPQPAPKPPVAEKSVKPAPEPKRPEPSLLDEILATPAYLGGLAAALLLAVLMVVRGLVASRRQKGETAFEENVMTGGDLQAKTVMGSPASSQAGSGDTSFLTDFSHAGLGSIDTGEVDPIAEAEVYMAYGRDTQAEEILKEAMAKDPSRQEIRVKLLEIYAARKDVASFEKGAVELQALGGQASPAWGKVAELGRSIDPDNPLYMKAEPQEPVPLESGLEAEAMVGGIPGTEAMILPSETGLEAAAAEDEGVVDLGLDLGAPEAEEVPPAEPEAQSEEAALATAEEHMEDEAMALDFNLDINEAEPEPEEPVKPAAEEEEHIIDFDIGLDMGKLAEKAAPAEEGAIAETAEEGLISADSWKEAVTELGSGEVAEIELSDAELHLPEEELELPPAEEVELSDEDLELPSVELELPEVEQQEPNEEEAEALDETLKLPEDVLASMPPVGDEAIEISAPSDEDAPLDFEFTLATDDNAPAAPPAKEAVPDLNLSGISLDLGEGSAAAAAPAPVEAIEATDLTLEQDVATKLDLAKAYMEMGDKEGAREIFEEVLKEGSQAQKNEATKLMAELG